MFMAEKSEFWARVMVASMAQAEVARMEQATKSGQGYIPRNAAIIVEKRVSA